ncbi:MAG: hypothetical protein ACRDFZ_02305 [Candidatus Limnocylindria bacterium]
MSPEPRPVADDSERPLLEYVTMANCRDCRRLERLLAEVRPDFPGVEVREVPADSARGRQASLELGVLRFPVVLLDGDIIAVERISEEDLRWFLAQATA